MSLSDQIHDYRLTQKQVKDAMKKLKDEIDAYHSYLNGIFGGLIVSRNLQLKEFSSDKLFNEIIGKKLMVSRILNRERKKEVKNDK